jgi:hypothetical protein
MGQRGMVPRRERTALMIDIARLAPFMLANKSFDELEAIKQAALAIIYSFPIDISPDDLIVSKHAGLIYHYARENQDMLAA